MKIKGIVAGLAGLVLANSTHDSLTNRQIVADIRSGKYMASAHFTEKGPVVTISDDAFEAMNSEDQAYYMFGVNSDEVLLNDYHSLIARGLPYNEAVGTVSASTRTGKIVRPKKNVDNVPVMLHEYYHLEFDRLSDIEKEIMFAGHKTFLNFTDMWINKNELPEISQHPEIRNHPSLKAFENVQLLIRGRYFDRDPWEFYAELASPETGTSYGKDISFVLSIVSPNAYKLHSQLVQKAKEDMK